MTVKTVSKEEAALMVLQGHGAWWNEDHKLVLLSLDAFRDVPDDVVLRDIFGMEALRRDADDDTRGGMVAFGYDVV